jgi:hypothetical protein
VSKNAISSISISIQSIGGMKFFVERENGVKISLGIRRMIAESVSIA